jgi:SnoaL-like domain
MPTEPQAVDALIKRVERLEAFEAIRGVMAAYARAADDRHGCSVNVEKTMQLFAREAVWDGRPRYGRHEGWDAIHSYLSRGKAGIDWSLHHLVDVSIDVADDGWSARGRWYLLEMARMANPSGGKAEIVWLGGTYDNEFVRKDGGWKLSLMRFDCQAILGPSGVWQEPRSAVVER